MSTFDNVSRRGFLGHLVSAGALVLGARLVSVPAQAAGSAGGLRANDAALHPNLFVGVDTDGTVYIVATRSEMGTGIRTSLPLILADELEADWSRVRIEQAPGDKKYGDQDTDGSHSVRDFYMPMREAGATVRLMLVRAAASTWGVPESECEGRLHEVAHPATGRKLGYGELASAASKLPVPKKEEVRLKPKSAWRYIGKETQPYDLKDFVTGRAGFGIDARLDGMLYASIEHPPVLGGKLKSFDNKAALSVAGVQRTELLDPFKPPHAFQPLGGVAVLASNTWAAMQGRKKLNVQWEDGANAVYNSAPYREELLATAKQPGRLIRNAGNAEAEFAKGGKVFEASYYVPHLAHASMEPPMALANYRDGKVEVWTCTQNPQGAQDTVAQAVGVAPADVTVHVTLLGGGFGRKSKPDYVAEAAFLSKKAGKPVKVVWSREDDIKFDYYHAVAGMYMKAKLGGDGKPVAWLQRSVFPPIQSTFEQNAQYGSAGEMSMGWSDVPYDIPNLRVENGPAPAHVRIGWLRSVSNIYHAFAVGSFADELAHEAGRDPLEYLLDLIGKPRVLDLKAQGVNYHDTPGFPIETARLRHVLEVAAEKAQWGKRKPGNGWGMGIAVHRSFLTYVATVVEVEVDGSGKVTIPRVHYALDAGLIANPERVRSQFEGASVFGTSIALFGEITATNGRIDQSNFNDYVVTRINRAPRETFVYMVESEAPPAGVGEPGVPPFAPALCNAVFAATGKRVRDLPLSRHGFA
ncbi:MAG TPA: molybdopterin cofactor-binding domain-containing protein [Bryobacteraceae bacterium]|nr:molybdopterin cofactor-binding domain-containing protein [Bryobacteraceae bacterium]